jgi:hypothetical protein
MSDASESSQEPGSADHAWLDQLHFVLDADQSELFVKALSDSPEPGPKPRELMKRKTPWATSELIRREQAASSEIETIRKALIEGEESGEPESFDFDAFKRNKSSRNCQISRHPRV